MRSALRFAFILVTVVAIASCRQADGPVPAPDAGRQEELNDVARDLELIASGSDPEAPKYLADDLRRYARDRSMAAADELSRRVTNAVADTALTADTARQLALNLWVALTARELSERQIEDLQNEVHGQLTSAGIPDDRARPVSDQIGAVQQAVTARPRRWYELF